MDKKIVVAELRNIFNLLNACFDKDALLKLISAKKINIDEDKETLQKPTNINFKYWDRGAREYYKREGIDLPADFSIDKFVHKKLKSLPFSMAEDAKESLMLDVFNYLFEPTILGHPDVETAPQAFKRKIKENPNEEHDVADFLKKQIQYAIKKIPSLKKQHEKDFEKARNQLEKKYNIEVTDEDAPIEPGETVDPTKMLEKKKSPKKEKKLVDLANNIAEHIEDITQKDDIKELKHSYEFLVDAFTDYINKHAKDNLTKQVFKMIMDIPDMTTQNVIAKKLGENPKVIERVINIDIKHLLIKFAEEIDNTSLIDAMEKLKLIKYEELVKPEKMEEIETINSIKDLKSKYPEVFKKLMKHVDLNGKGNAFKIFKKISETPGKLLTISSLASLVKLPEETVTKVINEELKRVILDFAQKQKDPSLERALTKMKMVTSSTIEDKLSSIVAYISALEKKIKISF